MTTPEKLRYTKDHEWVLIEGNKGRIGITDHAQQALGDITFVELPAVGRKVAAHDGLAVVESVKAASDIYAPLAGKVAEVNKELQTAPEMINKDPYGKGWIALLQDVDTAALSTLMTAADYDKFAAEK
jgi:glycine cleavage system H protein